MRIAMIGQKRFGSREGGIEVVVTELSRRMASLGHEVTCYDRGGRDVMTGEITERERYLDGVRTITVTTIDKKGLAALTSSFFATLKVICSRPDVVHYHAEGPCVPMFLARLAGLRTVATIHGLDWRGTKWGRLARSYIKLGEKVAVRCADVIIVLSRSTQKYFSDEYGRETRLIPNGIEIKERAAARSITRKWNLSSETYILYLGRIVPDKGIECLIDAYRQIDTKVRLVIAGGGSDTAEYESKIHERAKGDSRILFTGFVKGREYEELISNALIFVLPSEREGMPMSLLEAMAYGRCCITSDISECADVVKETGITFRTGNVESLLNVLEKTLNDKEMISELGRAAQKRVRERFDWEEVVNETIELYSNIAKKARDNV